MVGYCKSLGYRMQQIIVYVDKGVDGVALKHTVKSLQQEIDKTRYSLKRMDADTLKEGGWEKETALLVIPGGRDIFYHEALDGKGTDKIRSFVEQGGSYFGLCAGAYFACDAIEFEKGGISQVCEKRSLKLYPGLAEGPAYGNNKYRFDGLQGIEAAHVSWKDKKHLHVYFNGGCHFEGAAQHPNVKVLGSYLELENDPPAIIQCSVGKGNVVLSGVHLEYGIPLLHRSNPYVERIFPLLEKSEEMRKTVFREILQSLNVL